MPLSLPRDEFATAGDAARLLGISETRVRQLAVAGVLAVAAFTPHGRLFDRDAVRALARKRAERRNRHENR